MILTGARGLAADLETDGQGHFDATELSAGDYRLEITKPNYLSATVHLHLAAAGATSSVRLIRCAAITGQVTDRSGQPVHGATVYAMAKPSAGKPPQRDFTMGHVSYVDQSGNYRLYGLPPGSYLVAVSYGSSATVVGSVGSAPPPGGNGSGVLFYPDNTRPQPLDLGAGEERHNLNFSVVAASLYSVSGRISFSDPKARFWLSLSSLDQPAIAVSVVPAANDQSFRFEGIPPGSYNLTAFGPTGGYGGRGAILNGDALFARAIVNVGAQNVEGILLTPEKGRSVSFLLRAAANATCPATAQLALSPLEDLGAMIDRKASLNAGKEETVEFLAPARYSIVLTGLGDNCFLTSDAALDVNQTTSPVTLTIASAGAIRGKLDAGGQPASSFTVVLLPADALDTANAVLATVPDAQSQFAFTGLRPGRYRIAAQAGSRWLANSNQSVELEVRGGANLQIDLAAPAEKKP